ncbi:hypothetical protein VPH35_081075 [Triticum aestivum]|uniref:Uncharacterized protein n=1 Tax=Triticum urartu TaxID=4572 RepID=A0A8R7UDU1_TRIUA
MILYIILDIVLEYVIKYIFLLVNVGNVYVLFSPNMLWSFSCYAYKFHGQLTNWWLAILSIFFLAGSINLSVSFSYHSSSLVLCNSAIDVAVSNKMVIFVL